MFGLGIKLLISMIKDLSVAPHKIIHFSIDSAESQIHVWDLVYNYKVYTHKKKNHESRKAPSIKQVYKQVALLS